MSSFTSFSWRNTVKRLAIGYIDKCHRKYMKLTNWRRELFWLVHTQPRTLGHCNSAWQVVGCMEVDSAANSLTTVKFLFGHLTLEHIPRMGARSPTPHPRQRLRVTPSWLDLDSAVVILDSIGPNDSLIRSGKISRQKSSPRPAPILAVSQPTDVWRWQSQRIVKLICHSTVHSHVTFNNALRAHYLLRLSNAPEINSAWGVTCDSRQPMHSLYVLCCCWRHV